jgi:predicted ArsR family transcriptional regulator
MSKADKQLEQQLENLVVLGDPVRRALYLHVLGRNDDVSRDQAARALRVSRALAAFHLDKLVDAGLLEISFRRLSGRTGPGAGRPSKLYRRSSRQIDVTLPARRYELAARLLARATSERGATAAAALEQAAETWGREIGSEARGRSGARPDGARLLRGALEALRATGFEPRRDPNGDVVLQNCPFAALQRETPTLICGMNLALCRGLVAGLQAAQWTARLEPGVGRCCVVIQTQ